MSLDSLSERASAIMLKARTALTGDAQTGNLDVTFSPDGRYVALLPGNGQLGQVQVFSTQSGGLVATINNPSASAPLAFSPDDTKLAVGSGSNVDVYLLTHTASPFAVHALTSPPGLGAHCCDVDSPTSLAWSPGGNDLAAGSADSWVRIWVGSSSAPVYLDDDINVSVSGGLAFSPDGRCLLGSGGESDSGSGASQLWAWQAATEFTLGLSATVRAQAFSPDSGSIAIATAQGIVIWDLGLGTSRFLTVATSSGAVANDLSYSLTGRYLAASFNDGQVRVWRTARPGAPVGSYMPSAQDQVNGIIFDATGNELALGEDASASDAPVAVKGLFSATSLVGGYACRAWLFPPERSRYLCTSTTTISSTSPPLPGLRCSLS